VRKSKGLSNRAKAAFGRASCAPGRGERPGEKQKSYAKTEEGTHSHSVKRKRVGKLNTIKKKTGLQQMVTNHFWGGSERGRGKKNILRKTEGGGGRAPLRHWAIEETCRGKKRKRPNESSRTGTKTEKTEMCKPSGFTEGNWHSS